MFKLGSKIERASELEEFVQLFAINNKENSSNQKLPICWMAKTLMNSYILCKNWDFSKRISPKLFVISGPNFQRQRNCYAFFNIRGVTLSPELNLTNF